MEKCRARSPHPETGFGNGFVAVVEILFYFLRQRLYPARFMTVQDAVSNIEKWKSIARSLTLLLALAAINPCAQATEISPDVDAIFDLYCYNCHDDLVQKGEVDLIALPELDQDARLELLNRIEEQVYLSQMPPKNKEQPTATEKEQLLAWVSESFAALDAKSEFREKLHEPEFGNYVDHDKLFSGEIKEMPFSPARRWLISPYIFDRKIQSIVGRAAAELEIMNPMHLPDVSGVRDYDNKIAGGDHFVTMLANANAIADHQLAIISPEKFKAAESKRAALLSRITDYERTNPNHPFLPTFREQLAKQEKEIKEAKEAARKEAKIDAPFRTITTQPTPPGEAEMKAAILHQYALVYEREPNPSELAGCLKLLQESIAKVGNTEGLKRMLMAVLLQPDFLYRSELGEGPEDEYGRRRLSSREASYAIAYALTERGPDKLLKLAAQRDQLKTKQQYQKHVERLLAAPGGKILIDDRTPTARTRGYSTLQPAKLRFFREFFGYSKAYQIFKDNKRFEGATHRANRNSHEIAIRQMINEADLMVDRILERDENVFQELLTSNRFYLYHNGDNEEAQKILAERKRLLEKMAGDYQEMTPKKFWETYRLDLDVQFGINSRGKMDQDVVAEIDRRMKSIPLERELIIYPNRYTPHIRIPVRDGMMAKNRTNMFNIDHNTWSYVAEQPFEIPNRMGILTHPTWLTAHSLNTSTDPVVRGKWIREKLLAGFVPDVPISVDAAIPEDHNKTLRQRLHDKTKSESCWKCHERMNPLGYAFEMYDDFGRFRQEEELEYPEHLIIEAPDDGPYTRNTYKTMPLDTTGYLSGTGDAALDGEVTDALDLIDRLAKADRVRQSIIRHAFRFFMGRNELLSDSQTLIAADQAYLESGGSFNAVIVSLLTSDSFMYRR